MTADCDIAIVGGGHTGLLLGCALARPGFTIALIEPAPIETAPGPADGRNLALLRGTREIAERIGIWPHLAPVASPVERIEVEERPGGARLVYDSVEDRSTPYAYGVEHASLRAALARAFRAVVGNAIHLRTSLTGLEREPDHMRLRLDDGSSLRARLVIGSDGRGSRVRALARIGLDRWQYDQAALAFIVEHDGPGDGTIREWLRPGGPLALLPVGERRTGVTWVEPRGRAAGLLEAEERALLAELARQTDKVLGACRLASSVGAWPLSAQHARRYVGPRVALVGDAAHGVHPIHAQGFNMAVADVAALADLLVRARGRNRDPGSAEVLLAYERARWWPNQQRIWMTDGMNRIFSNGAAGLAPLRRAAVEMVARVAPLRRLAVAHGTRFG